MESKNKSRSVEKKAASPCCSLKVEGTQTELVAACSPSVENQTQPQSEWGAKRKEE